MKSLVAALVALGLTTGGVYAKPPEPPVRWTGPSYSYNTNVRTVHDNGGVVVHRHHLRHRRRRVYDHNLTYVPGGLVTVNTAAGIKITVAQSLAPRFIGFTKELVDDGYKPHSISCWAPVGTHVPNSNHYHGGACDYDQTGWNRTARFMYHVGDIAKRWGLRDGCTFRRPDCGHIDDGQNIGWKHPNLITRFIDWTLQPIKEIVKPILPPMEE